MNYEEVLEFKNSHIEKQIKTYTTAFDVYIPLDY